MDTHLFHKLLLKTAFCCLASNGNVDFRKTYIVKKLYENSLLFKGFNFSDELNSLYLELNMLEKKFIDSYLNLLSSAILTEKEEIIIIDIAINIIKADEYVNYSKIKFFKKIRQRLKLSDEKILEEFPDIEQFIEEDNINESLVDEISNQFLENNQRPQYEILPIIKIGFPVEE